VLLPIESWHKISSLSVILAVCPNHYMVDSEEMLARSRCGFIVVTADKGYIGLVFRTRTCMSRGSSGRCFEPWTVQLTVLSESSTYLYGTGTV
jgi:hypothetical protein